MDYKKLLSKKLFFAVFGVVVVLLNEVFGLKLDEETLWLLATIIASYIFGQGAVDVAAQVKEGKIEAAKQEEIVKRDF